ncbi:restriction endonuclease subunit S [Treponema phagedenis]|uniref:Restriction endonuclease subunit S n=1 Tax=Treponema phagedenis TaxID=162 RepID=A0AAE6M7L1_TREPH|nr:restriction endonuclease subunit S [Treponema phagedenis]QEJ98623.1 restriction endonuclease subunit S [Treponema phagedenis]
MSKLNLKDVEWKEFFIGELFDVNTRGKRLIISHREKGGIPFITAGESNNGISGFIDNPLQKQYEKAISLDMFGNSFYQDFKFKCDDNITILKNKHINKNTGIFISSILKRLTEKYSYGNQIRPNRLKKDKIMLPVDNQGNTHWEFMENYIKQEQKAQVQKIIDYYEQKILQNGFTLLDFKNIEWKAFKFNEIFRKIKRGKRLTKANQITGNIPYISSTALNNGIDNFIKNSGNVRKGKNALTVANSGSVGSCFYHCYEYIASDHVTSLQASNADKYIYLFMSTIIKRLEEKYSFNREINDERIKAEKIILPIDKNGNPHWEYMSKFMQKLEVEKISNFLPYIYIYI